MKENDASPKSIEANVDASVHARSAATNANSELARAGKSGHAKKLIKENDTSPNPMEANVDASLHSHSAPLKASMAPAKSSNCKRQKGKSKKAADAFVPASTVDFGALGSLIPHDKTRVRHISQQAADADNSNLGLFTKCDTLSSNDRRLITAALERSPTFRLSVPDFNGDRCMEERPVLNLRGDDIVQSDFRRLRDGDWLNDNTLTPFLKKYVKDAVPLVHVFPTHFFTRLRTGGQYRFSNVERWGRRVSQRLREEVDGHIVDGWDRLEVLYVPINIGNWHWVFIRVDMSCKAIELYDSQGYVKPGNIQYLRDMRRYMYDELTKNIQQDCKPPFEVWRRGWRAVDKS